MAGTIKTEVLKVFNEQRVFKGNLARIQVVKYIDSIFLEKRLFWKDSEGEEMYGKAKGFNLKDLQLIADNFEEIVTLMGGTTDDKE